MIPKKIWQTYKLNYNELPEYALAASDTWVQKNPEWEYNYLSDSDVMDFVHDNFDNEWVEVFHNKCPVGVMRADIWRVMTLYINGGIYADLDTTCNTPVDIWMRPWLDKRVIINAEHEIHIQQWAFLSEPKHPVFEYMLNKMLEGFRDPDFTNPHFVHALTGPGIFTRSILEFINLWNPTNETTGEIYKSDPWAQINMHGVNLVNQVDIFNSNPIAIDNAIFMTPSHRFFHNEVITHLYGSQVWDDGRYSQWIIERDNIVNE